MSFIPYQIDYSVQNTAKTIGFSKKRIVFKFGFANRTAIEVQHKTGAECRGSEHEVTLIWSLTSGKRQVFCDNQEIHYSCSHQNGWTNDTSWQHMFTLPDPTDPHHRYRIHISTTRETNAVSASTHPFDLKINHVSYFAFNPIYQLGTPRMMVVPFSSSSSTSQSSHRFRSESPMSPEERQQMALAKLASLQDIAQQRSSNGGTQAVPNHTTTTTKETVPQPLQKQQQQQDDLLISFDDEDKKDMAAIAVPSAPPQEHSITSIGFASSSSSLGGLLPSTTTNTNHPHNRMNASSITFDANYSMNQNSSMFAASGHLDGGGGGAAPDFNRQQPGSYYANSTTNSNPYGSTQPSYGNNSNGTNTNPYNSSTTDPNTTNTSMALTPYQPPASAAGVPSNSYYPNAGNYYASSSSSSQPQSYIDATGRLNIGVPPPVTNVASQQYNPYELPSPSATSVFTYGSAPSFAQPPKIPVAPQATTATAFPSYNNNDFNYNSSVGNPYGNTVPMTSATTTTSPYGTAPTSLYPPSQPSYASTPSYQY